MSSGARVLDGKLAIVTGASRGERPFRSNYKQLVANIGIWQALERQSVRI